MVKCVKCGAETNTNATVCAGCISLTIEREIVILREQYELAKELEREEL